MAQNNFTIKASEALQQAQQIAFTNKNPNIEIEHLLKALIDSEDSSVDYLLKKNNVTVNLVTSKLEELIKKLPTVSSEPAQTMGRETNNILLKANGVLKTFGDEFITPEHLLLAILHGNDASAKLLKDAGLTEKGLVASIKELRKGETVNSAKQEAQFNALNKYAKNLNEMARSG